MNHRGIILSANAGVKSLLGYEKPASIVGENVSILVPEPFSKMHNGFVAGYLQSGESLFLQKMRKILVVQSSGYIIPVFNYFNVRQ